MELTDKLEILADAAKYDASCASSGAAQRSSRGKDGLGALDNAPVLPPVLAPSASATMLLRRLWQRLEGELTRPVERLIDAVVDAVAGDDERRLELGEHATETLMQIGARKATAGVARLGETRGRLAREAHVHDRRPTHALLGANGGLDVDRPVAAVSDAVAKEEDARFKFISRSAGGEQNQQGEKEAWHPCRLTVCRKR